MNGLTTIAALPRAAGAGAELKGEANIRPKPVFIGMDYAAGGSVSWSGVVDWAAYDQRIVEIRRLWVPESVAQQVRVR